MASTHVAVETCRRLSSSPPRPYLKSPIKEKHRSNVLLAESPFIAPTQNSSDLISMQECTQCHTQTHIPVYIQTHAHASFESRTRPCSWLFFLQAFIRFLTCILKFNSQSYLTLLVGHSHPVGPADASPCWLMLTNDSTRVFDCSAMNLRSPASVVPPALHKTKSEERDRK